MVKESKENTRNSSFELMRIISMFLIIVYHVILHGKILENVDGVLEIIVRLIMALTLVHVSSYILVSGYFQHDKKMKLSKVISLNNAVWFYTVAIAIVAYYVLSFTFDNVAIFKIIMPINYNQYWFITNYLVLYLITPLLNMVIQNSSQKKMNKILATLFFITSFLPTITGDSFFDVNKGHSLYYMIFLYFTGSYLNKYPIKENKIFKKYSKRRCLLLFTMIYFATCFMNFLMYKLGVFLSTGGELNKYFGELITNSFLAYNNPLIYIASISYFLIFENIKFSNKLINRIASLMFGIYLIHENNLIKEDTLKSLGFLAKSYSYRVIPKIFIVAAMIFVICAIIEYIRQAIFKFIYNLKISKWNRKKYREYIRSLGIEINW